jgi:hypothetical protein
MLFLSLFKNLYDNKEQLERLFVIPPPLPLTPLPASGISIDEELANIKRNKNSFDYGGFTSVDLNSDIIGMDPKFLEWGDEEGSTEKKEEDQGQGKRARGNLDIVRQEDEDADLLEALVRVSVFFVLGVEEGGGRRR